MTTAAGPDVSAPLPLLPSPDPARCEAPRGRARSLASSMIPFVAGWVLFLGALLLAAMVVG
jgi:hypothetical protein